MERIDKNLLKTFYTESSLPSLNKRAHFDLLPDIFKHEPESEFAFEETRAFEKLKRDYQEYLDYWLHLREQYLYFKNLFLRFNQQMDNLFESVKQDSSILPEMKKNKSKKKNSFEFVLQNKQSNKYQFELDSQRKSQQIQYEQQLLMLNRSNNFKRIQNTFVKNEMQTRSPKNSSDLNLFENPIQRSLRLANEKLEMKIFSNEFMLNEENVLPNKNSKTSTNSKKFFVPVKPRIKTENIKYKSEGVTGSSGKRDFLGGGSFLESGLPFFKSPEFSDLNKVSTTSPATKNK